MDKKKGANQDANVVSGFGDEWSRFDQSTLDSKELDELYRLYFGIFPFKKLAKNAVGFDLGSGSGRWARCVAPRVGKLICIDASREALAVARRNLASQKNCEFVNASVGQLPLANGSMDFGYSLGVLHHVPDTVAGLRECVAKLKHGAPFLLYLYYAFDGRPIWFRGLWKASDLVRRIIAGLPHSGRYVSSQLMAGSVYFPLARTAWLLEKLKVNVENFPLSFYRHRSFYTMRTDALDRFGTRLEQRFTREQIEKMMQGRLFLVKGTRSCRA
ncbi:MAG: class I SAM-dependent methyltransferase [Deltaproteobacteria bacterium]|nr:class I SAM-dependent methyltransferase [Deltaproteobacteria bacterium]